MHVVYLQFEERPLPAIGKGSEIPNMRAVGLNGFAVGFKAIN